MALAAHSLPSENDGPLSRDGDPKRFVPESVTADYSGDFSTSDDEEVEKVFQILILSFVLSIL
jgi:hypothetical protein